MLPITVQTGGLEDKYGVDTAYRMIKEAGFDGVDANICAVVPCEDLVYKHIKDSFLKGSEKDVMELFSPWKQASEKYGLPNRQAHAPFPSYIDDGNEDGSNQKIIQALIRSIHGADWIGCRNLVIHPVQVNYKFLLTPEQEWELNLSMYSQMIPAAKEYGVTICLENLFTWDDRLLYAGCCAHPSDAAKYVDELNSVAGQEVFGFCLDTGHANVVGEDLRNALRVLNKRIKCFHLHDNSGHQDQHLAPYMGALDWEHFIQGLNEIQYENTLNFETFHALEILPEELYPDMLKWIRRCGEYFCHKAGL